MKILAVLEAVWDGVRGFTVNLGWIVLSLFLATALWFLVTNQSEITAFVSVPLQYRNLATDMEIASNPVESVMLELRGPAGELQDFSKAKAAVAFDLAAVGPGDHTFTVDDAAVHLPRGVRLVRSLPAQLRFRFERSLTRDVPVKVRHGRGPHGGYLVVAEEVEPPTVRIAGPETRVREVTAAETDPIDVSEAVSAMEFRTAVSVNDEQIRLVSRPQVTVRVQVRKQ